MFDFTIEDLMLVVAGIMATAYVAIRGQRALFDFLSDSEAASRDLINNSSRSTQSPRRDR